MILPEPLLPTFRNPPSFLLAPPAWSPLPHSSTTASIFRDIGTPPSTQRASRSHLRGTQPSHGAAHGTGSGGLASELNDGMTAQGQVIPGEFGKCETPPGPL